MEEERRPAADDPRKAALFRVLRQEGIVDERVLEVMAAVPRDYFVDPAQLGSAWDNVALPISCGQTISQPYIVALMSQALELTGTERVLEVGTGSGYQAAILGLLAREVLSIERIPELAAQARRRLETLDIRNVTSMVGDGSVGWEQGAPYDAIMVTAGARAAPPALLRQLVDYGGRMVIPAGRRDHERPVLYRKHAGRLTERNLGDVRFVPLV